MKLGKILKRTAVIIIIATVIFGGSKLYPKLVQTIDSSYSFSAKKGEEFYLTAHRGLSSVAPENTGIALLKAGRAGYYAAEFDIMPSKDGKWVLMHDDTVDRMTDSTGEVSSFTYEELREMKIDSGNGIDNYPPKLGIKSLEEALEICEGYSMRAMIEIKGGEPEDMAGVLEIVNSMNLKTEPLIIDFDSERLKAIRAIDSEMELWYLVSKIDDGAIEFAKEHNTALAFNHKKLVNYTKLDDAKEAGIPLAAWTVDFLPYADILISCGVKYITTNRILPKNNGGSEPPPYTGIYNAS